MVETPRPRMRYERIVPILNQILEDATNTTSISEIEPLSSSLSIDSIMAVDIKDRIENTFGIEMPGTLLFDYPTVVSIGQYIEKRLNANNIEYVSDEIPVEENRLLIPQIGRGNQSFDRVTHVTSISCRYPGTDTGGDTGALFFRHLCKSVDFQSIVPISRWNMDELYSPYSSESNSCFYARYGSFCQNVADFDAQLFRLNHLEATFTDPQIRILMEEAAQGCSNCGIIQFGNSRKKTSPRYMHSNKFDSVGVFVGCMYHEYTGVISAMNKRLPPQAITGNGLPYMAGRISFTFGLTGPCISTDTACSSSLISTHLGHVAISRGECMSSVIAGSNIMLRPDTTAAICQLNALSPDGRCKTFDDTGDGYGRGEGFCVILLQPYNTNISPISCILSTSINQSGKSSGLTAPNGPSQTALMLSSLVACSQSPSNLSFLSIHGTGTALGDPIEIGAIQNVFVNTEGAPRDSSSISSVALVSNKSFYGHTEGAAGLSGMLTSVVGGNHSGLPPIRHLRAVNRYVSASLKALAVKRENSIFTMPRQETSLLSKSNEISGTSSFGMSGTNAHAILSREAQIEQNVQLPWSRRRSFPDSKYYLMAFRGKASLGIHSRVVVSCPLDLPQLSILWSNHVNDAPCLCTSTLLEVGSVSILACTKNVDNFKVSLQSIVVHKELEISLAEGNNISCNLDLMEGTIRVFSGQQNCMTSYCVRFRNFNADRAQKFQLKESNRNTERRIICTNVLKDIEQYGVPLAVGDADVPTEQRDSFLLHPAVLESCIVPIFNCNKIISTIEFLSIDSVHERERFKIQQYLGSNAIGLGNDPAAEMYGIHYRSSYEMSSTANHEELFYRIDWQVERSIYSDAAANEPNFITVRRGIDNHSATVASLLDVIGHVYEDSKLSKIAVTSLTKTSDCFSRHGRESESAAVAAILKNLPYELPSLGHIIVHEDLIKPKESAGSYHLQTEGGLRIGCPSSSSNQSSDKNEEKRYSSTSTEPLLIYEKAYNAINGVHQYNDGLIAKIRNKSCFISGGLGGIGAAISCWLASFQIPSLAIASRSGIALPETRQILNLNSLMIKIIKSNVSMKEDVLNECYQGREDHMPLGVALHSAGVQMEGKLLMQTPTTSRIALAPKIEALHRYESAYFANPCTENVLFSSISSIAGNLGHCNYVVANAMLDCYSDAMVLKGKPTIAVQWGAWSNVGMVTKARKLSAREARIFGMLTTRTGLNSLMSLLSGTIPIGYGESVIGVVPKTYWINLLKNVPRKPFMFSNLLSENLTDIAVDRANHLLDKAAEDVRYSIQANQPLNVSKERIPVILNEIVVAIIGSKPDKNAPLAEQGLDSLAGLELRQKIEEVFGIQPSTLIDNPGGSNLEEIKNELELHASSTLSEVDLTLERRKIDSRNNHPVKSKESPWISTSPISIKMRLFCLPWAGGVSEHLFSQWAMMLPASIQVCPIEIPGRGRRSEEPALTTVHGLAEVLARSLPLNDKPYAIFGTCLGAIVGYEMIRAIERSGTSPMPALFFPAAVSPPHLYAVTVMKIYLQRKLRTLLLILPMI